MDSLETQQRYYEKYQQEHFEEAIDEGEEEDGVEEARCREVMLWFCSVDFLRRESVSWLSSSPRL